MTENNEANLQKGLKAKKGIEIEARSAQSREGEIPCIVVYPDEKNVKGINHILNPLKQLLPEKGFKVLLLSDEIKPLRHYGETFQQLAEGCALGIIILDGLRPNVLLEFGILMGKNKPIIPLQDKKATVAIKSFYQQNKEKTGGLTSKQFNDLKEPPLGFFSYISDLQGLHVEIVNKDAPLEAPEYSATVIGKAIDELMPRITEEYNKLSLKPIRDINSDYLEKFHTVSLKILEYYVGREKFSAESIDNIVKEIKDLEADSGIHMPSQIYSTISSVYMFLAEEVEWKDVGKIIDNYNSALEICGRVLEFESTPATRSETQKKVGDIYWELSQYRDRKQNCKNAINAYEEALKVRTLDHFPMDYAMTQNNLGTAYRTLAEVEAKPENCKNAINAYEEALKVYTKEEFPEINKLVEHNIRDTLNFCGGKI